MPETIVIVLPTIVETPSRVVLFDEITIERIGELAVFAPVKSTQALHQQFSLWQKPYAESKNRLSSHRNETP